LKGEVGEGVISNMKERVVCNDVTTEVQNSRKTGTEDYLDDVCAGTMHRHAEMVCEKKRSCDQLMN